MLCSTISEIQDDEPILFPGMLFIKELHSIFIKEYGLSLFK
jgi:hypothetical protein